MRPARRTEGRPALDLIRPLQDALAARSASRQNANEERGKELSLKRKLPLLQQERAAIVAAMTTSRASALIDGATFISDEAPPRLAEIDRDIAAIPEAIRMQGVRVGAAATAVGAAETALAAAVLPFASEKQKAALARVRQGLADLSEPLSELVACDHIVTALLGGTYKVPRGAPTLFSGASLLRSLLAGLPPAFRPDQLNTASISEAIAASRDETLSLIHQEI